MFFSQYIVLFVFIAYYTHGATGKLIVEVG